jgi:hypothetical protein
MVLKLIISDRNNVNETMCRQDDYYAVIGITNPFPEPVNYFACSGKFKGLLKLEFEDSHPGINNDLKLLFNIKKSESIIRFTESMICNDVHLIIIHCDKGLHRSVAVGMKLRDIYSAKGYKVDLVNIPDCPEPNEYVLSGF